MTRPAWKGLYGGRAEVKWAGAASKTREGRVCGVSVPQAGLPRDKLTANPHPALQCKCLFALGANPGRPGARGGVKTPGQTPCPPSGSYRSTTLAAAGLSLRLANGAAERQAVRGRVCMHTEAAGVTRPAGGGAAGRCAWACSKEQAAPGVGGRAIICPALGPGQARRVRLVPAGPLVPSDGGVGGLDGGREGGGTEGGAVGHGEDGADGLVIRVAHGVDGGVGRQLG